MQSNVSILPFTAADAAAFKALNLHWIRTHWEPEPADYKALDHPFQLIDDGGFIFIAKRGEETVGTCALIKQDAQCYELAKICLLYTSDAADE